MKTIQIISLAAGVAILAGCTSYREKMGYSKPVTFEQLPQPAQQSVRNEIGTKQITKINEDTKDGQPAYRVQVEGKRDLTGAKPVLWVTPSGTILKESSSLSSEKGKVTEPAGAEAPSTRTDPDYQ